MTNSIPASQLVNVLPSVLSAGGNPLSLNSVFLTTSVTIPIGTVQPFSTLASVQAWFGANSQEASRAAKYFGGFTGANVVPGTLYFAQYNAAAAAGYMRGGSTQAYALTDLQALSGTLIVPVDGKTVTSANISLAGATSFSNAATLIQTGIQTTGGIWSGTASQAAGVVTIASTVSGILHVGDLIGGAGVTTATTIVSFGTYTTVAGTGTVNVSSSATVALGSANVTSTATVFYNATLFEFGIVSPTTGATSSVGFATGTLATGIKFTAATGAVLSPGSAADTPAVTMGIVVGATQNFATFMTVAEVALSVKLQFAAWVQTQSQRYAYVCQDSDVTALTANAAGCFGNIADAAADDGVVPVYDTTGGDIAAFVCGCAGSIDYTETQGRITFAYKGQAGLVAQITDPTIAANLIGNSYNFYGAYATAAQGFVMLQPGQITGKWQWIDAYVNQIYLNSQLQLALMELLTNVKSLPYNSTGYGLLRAACLDPINQALNNGTIQAGVPLSAAQAQEVNTAAGVKIDTTLTNVGWYLQIKPASPQARGNRTSPPMTLWYTDGGSIQQIQLASIDVQ